MYTANIQKSYNLIFFLFLILYLFLLLYIVPNNEFTSDRLSFFISFNNMPDRISSTQFFSPAVLIDEPLYQVIVYLLTIFFTPESIALILIGVSSSLSLITLFRAKPEFLPIIILVFLLPQFMGLFIAHLRQGLAVAVFLLMHFHFKKNLITSCFIAGLVHVSFFIALPILMLMQLKLRGKKLNFVTSLILIMSAFLLFYFDIFREIVYYFEFRQAGNYSFQSNDISGYGFLFWFAVYAFFFLGRKLTESNVLAMNIIGVYLASYFFVNFISRLLESFLALIFIELRALNSSASYMALIFYLLISWQGRLGLPLFGFGVS